MISAQARLHRKLEKRKKQNLIPIEMRFAVVIISLILVDSHGRKQF